MLDTNINKRRVSIRKRIIIPIIVLMAIYLLGTIGYMFIEKWSFLQSLFMSTITVSTVGLAAGRDLSQAGMLYTIFFIIISTGTAAYIVINTADLVVQNFLLGNFEGRRLKKMISKLKGHYIICGFGRVGNEIANALDNRKIPFIAIDKNEEFEEECKKNNWLYLRGDATEDDTLKEANIENAKALLAAIGDDSENIYTVLSARSLKQDIIIIARASSQEAKNKLKKAGADKIITPEIIGARRMATMALQPAVCDFLDGIIKTETLEMELAEIEIKNGSKISNMSIKDASKKFDFGALIISIVGSGDRLSLTKASGNTILKDGQKLIAIGTKEQIQELNDIAVK